MKIEKGNWTIQLFIFSGILKKVLYWGI